MSVWFSREGVQRERPLAKLQVNRLYVICLLYTSRQQAREKLRGDNLVVGFLIEQRTSLEQASLAIAAHPAFGKNAVGGVVGGVEAHVGHPFFDRRFGEIVLEVVEDVYKRQTYSG